MDILYFFLSEIFLTKVVFPAPEGEDRITITPAFFSAINLNS
jgi:hypothetical protein